ncbi:MAG: MMPL family transporter, partial [Oryzihumus sp.]
MSNDDELHAMLDNRERSGRPTWTAVASRRGAAIVLLLGLGLSAMALLLGPTPHAASSTASSLPNGAESTQVAELQQQFSTSDVAPAVVVFDRGGRPLTAEDKALIGRREQALADVGIGGSGRVVVSPGGTAALVAVPLRLGAPDLARSVTRLRTIAKQDLPSGLRAQVTGAPAFQVDLSAVFNGADASLLLTTVVVVAVLLLVTYRSPVLWLVPLLVVALSDQVSVRLLGAATDALGFSVDEATTGITSVLVFGAGTNYALLLIARYREELRREHDRAVAMVAALRRAGPAVVASSSTVVLALLTLSLADDPFVRGLGYAGALGIATAVVFALTLLPAALVVCGRGLFWPFIPRVGDPDPSRDGFWAKLAHRVGRRPVPVLAGSVLVLVLLALPLAGVQSGLSPAEQFRQAPEAVTGQEALAQAFPAGASEPTVVIAPAAQAGDVADRAARVEGVASMTPGPADGHLAELTVVLGAPRGSSEA